MRTGLASVKEAAVVLSELSKWRVSLFAGLCAACGYSMAVPPDGRALAVIAGTVFILSSGASSLNQLQEKERDALLERTRHRPLPSGRCSPHAVLVISIILIAAGLCMVLCCYRVAAFFACLSSLFFYNVVYTPLKGTTHFAIIAGAIAGALPPLIGWLAAGRMIPGFEIAALIFFLYLWQFPHFWLHCLYRRNDYGNKGIHSMAALFSDQQLRRIVFVWTLAMGVASLFLTCFALEKCVLSMMILVLTAVSTGKTVQILLWERGEMKLKSAFSITMYYGIIIVILLIIHLAAGHLPGVQSAS